MTALAINDVMPPIEFNPINIEETSITPDSVQNAPDSASKRSITQIALRALAYGAHAGLLLASAYGVVLSYGGMGFSDTDSKLAILGFIFSILSVVHQTIRIAAKVKQDVSTTAAKQTDKKVRTLGQKIFWWVKTVSQVGTVVAGAMFIGFAGYSFDMSSDITDEVAITVICVATGVLEICSALVF